MVARLNTPSRPRRTRFALVGVCLLGALGGCSRDQTAATPAASAATRGAQLYTTSCIACHQADGHGIARVYPSLAGSGVVNGDGGELARWVIKGQRPATLPAGRFSSVMPQYGWLNNEDAAALLTHVRSSFGNQAAPVGRDDIARALSAR
jgi:mono/diheme cytochrome c family protein